MIKITEDKLGTLTENIEKGLRYIGKAMQCLDDLQGGNYGERGGMNYRYPEMPDEMGMRSGMRYPDMEMGMRGGYGEREEYGERRGRDSMGRYTRM